MTLQGEYASIMRMRSLCRPMSGRSSALKTDGGATPSSRATSTLRLPADRRVFFAKTARSAVVKRFFFAMEWEYHKLVESTTFFLSSEIFNDKHVRSQPKEIP